jgi:hypothetical protein
MIVVIVLFVMVDVVAINGRKVCQSCSLHSVRRVVQLYGFYSWSLLVY